MSGIAAIIHFDGKPIEPGAIERMTTAMDYRGPDGITHWHRGSVALGHCMMRTTAESLDEIQPLCSEDGSLVLLMDGWLSNWKELRSELLTRGACLRSRSDAELVLHAYEIWGDDCPSHIDGEYAFLIWDMRRQELFCTRDHAGLRPLNYFFDGRRLILASDIAGVLSGPGVPQQLNRGFIAEIITDDCQSRCETVWQDIFRPLPAQCVTFRLNDRRVETYWNPAVDVEIRYGNDNQYFDHYRSILTECVRRASRSHLPVGCDVSGGLDSSAIFSIANALHADGRLPAPDLLGYTLLNEPGTRADEIGYARSVARHTGRQVREVAPFLPDLAWFAERGRSDQDAAPPPNAAMMIGITEALRNDGCRISLTGDGGDEWLTGRRWYYHEQLRERDWSSLFASFRDDVAAAGVLSATGWLARFGLAPFLPRRVLDIRHRIHRASQFGKQGAPDWLSQELGALWAQRRSASMSNAFQNVRNIARRAMHMELRNAFCLLAHERMNRQSARYGVEQRYPMYARSFVEFAFATPERLRLRGDQFKFVHIRSMRDLLPDEVARRTSKAEFSLAFTRLLDRMQSLLVDGLPRNGTGHLDPVGMARLYERYRSAPFGQKPMWEIWGIFSCEGVFGDLPQSAFRLPTGD